MSHFAYRRAVSIGIALALAWVAFAGSERANGETVVRVVIVSREGLEGSDQDAAMVKDLFEKGLSTQAKLEFAPPIVVPAEKGTKGPIVQAIRDLPSDEDDVIVVYYSGHGGFSEARNEHVLLLGSEELPRFDLRGLLFSKKMKLGVILTDCCSDILPGKAAKPTINEANFQRTMKMLFLESRGMVDITSASTGERAWGETAGGLFTRVFFESAWSRNQMATNWSEFFEVVKKGTQVRFVGFKEALGTSDKLGDDDKAFIATQQAQTPEAFQLGGWKRLPGDPAPPPAARLGTIPPAPRLPREVPAIPPAPPVEAAPEPPAPPAPPAKEEPAPPAPAPEAPPAPRIPRRPRPAPPAPAPEPAPPEPAPEPAPPAPAP